MKREEIALRRLRNQLITGEAAPTPAEAVARLGAIQAQDYGAAKWAIGLRTTGGTEASVDTAIAARQIVRTWPMRGTLHFVAAPDVRWMLSLLAPRVLARAAKRHRELELDAAVFVRAGKVLIRALQGGRRLGREETLAVLERGGVSPQGQRGYHLLWRLAQEGILCFAAPEKGKKPTFALLEEWVAPAPAREREEALAELAWRYIAGHGPACAADLAWWSGLGAADVREALALATPRLEKIDVEGVAYWMAPGGKTAPKGTVLLPAFDEYLLGYRERDAVIDPAHFQKVCPGGNGIFLPMVAIDGRIVGTWKRKTGKKGVAVTVQPFAKAPANGPLAMAAAAYGTFLNLPSTLSS